MNTVTGHIVGLPFRARTVDAGPRVVEFRDNGDCWVVVGDFAHVPVLDFYVRDLTGTIVWQDTTQACCAVTTGHAGKRLVAMLPSAAFGRSFGVFCVTAVGRDGLTRWRWFVTRRSGARGGGIIEDAEFRSDGSVWLDVATPAGVPVLTFRIMTLAGETVHTARARDCCVVMSGPDGSARLTARFQAEAFGRSAGVFMVDAVDPSDTIFKRWRVAARRPVDTLLQTTVFWTGVANALTLPDVPHFGTPTFAGFQNQQCAPVQPPAPPAPVGPPTTWHIAPWRVVPGVNTVAYTESPEPPPLVAAWQWWYDSDDQQLAVSVESSPGNFTWAEIPLGPAGDIIQEW